MAYITYSMLINKKTFLEKKANLTEDYMVYAPNRTKIFLSHRHEDEKIVLAAVGCLYLQGIDAYVDWLDASMPKITNTETANNIKGRIKSSKKFILLATENSIHSVWIPWELGLADGVKGFENIAIMPVTKEPYNWEQREYYGIYNTLKIGQSGELEIFAPNSKRGVSLKNWINEFV